MMRKRKPMKRKASRKDFSKKAKVHRKNTTPGPMRGGIRL